MVVAPSSGVRAASEMSTVSLVPLAVNTSPVFEVDTGSFLAIVATAAVAGTLVAVAGGRGLFLRWSWSS